MVAWLAGLAVWPSNLDVNAFGGQVLAAYGGHQGVAMTQSLLVPVRGRQPPRRRQDARPGRHGGQRGRAGAPGPAAAFLAGLPRRPAGLALVVSGVSYLVLSTALAPAAFVSGPLLLLWVVGAGISLEG